MRRKPINRCADASGKYLLFVQTIMEIGVERRDAAGRTNERASFVFTTEFLYCHILFKAHHGDDDTVSYTSAHADSHIGSM